MRLALTLVFLTACAHPVFGPKQVKLRYLREAEAAPDAPSCGGGLNRIDVRDTRQNPQAIGERVDDETLNTAPITANEPAAAWLKDGLESQARNAQFLLGNANHPTLDVAITKIDMREKNGSYDARIVVDVALLSPNGQRCVNASFEGTGKNYGNAGDSTNYLQTMNRTLDALASRLLGSEALREAACRCAASP